MEIILFQAALVSRNEDGTFSIALSAHNNGEKQVILRASAGAATTLAIALALELLRKADQT